MLKRLLAKQQIRFLLIGSLNTVGGYLLFALALALLGNPLYVQAYLFSYLVALVIGFTLQKTIVFRAKGNLLLDFLRYTSVQAVSFAINLLALPLLVELSTLTPLVAQAIVQLTLVIASYFAHRYFSFMRKPVVERKNT